MHFGQGNAAGFDHAAVAGIGGMLTQDAMLGRNLLATCRQPSAFDIDSDASEQIFKILYARGWTTLTIKRVIHCKNRLFDLLNISIFFNSLL